MKVVESIRQSGSGSYFVFDTFCLLEWVGRYMFTFQNKSQTVAIKCITKKNLNKTQSVLSKEIKILEVVTDHFFQNHCISLH